MGDGIVFMGGFRYNKDKVRVSLETGTFVRYRLRLRRNVKGNFGKSQRRPWVA